MEKLLNDYLCGVGTYRVYVQMSQITYQPEVLNGNSLFLSLSLAQLMRQWIVQRLTLVSHKSLNKNWTKQPQFNNDNGSEWRRLPKMYFKCYALIGPLEPRGVNSHRYEDNIQLMILITREARPWLYKLQTTWLLSLSLWLLGLLFPALVQVVWNPNRLSN